MKILRGCVVLALLLTTTLIWTATSQSKGKKKNEKIKIELEIRNGTFTTEYIGGYPALVLHGDVYLKNDLVGTYDETSFPGPSRHCLANRSLL